jgi:hypothetical protein
MRQKAASHCVFAKMSPQIGDFHAAASNIPCFDTLSVETAVQLVLGGLLI